MQFSGNLMVKKMTSEIFILLSLLFTINCSNSDSELTGINPNDSLSIPGYNLVWHDEFNGSSIDEAKWRHEVNGYGGGNNELQYYTDRTENSFVSKGLLNIVANQEVYTGSDGTRSYTSARLNTKLTQSFKYGKITARIKLPYGQGIWPAFWMLGSNIDQVGWPKCGEIDIMEMVGGGDERDNVIYGTLHWDNNGIARQGGNTNLSTGIFADDFHEFTVDWDSTKVYWYLDGNLFYSLNITDPTLSEFHEQFFLILNLAVGGNWPGNPSEATVFPQTMYVDYVRVYQKK